MMKAGFKGNFSSTMQERSERWASQRLSATITVPPELYWWYIQEYGIDHEYTISAINVSTLALPDGGFPVSVLWKPGRMRQGTHTVRTVKATLPELASEFLRQSFAANPNNPTAVKDAFVTEFMVQVKAEIVKQMAAYLPGTRESVDSRFPAQAGKLHGRTAAEVFDEEATIVSE